MSTGYNTGKKRIWKNRHFRYIAVLFIVCVILYHLPIIVGSITGTGADNALADLHNLEGIDVLAILFLAPVIYISYIYGIVPSIFSAAAIILIILPHTLMIEDSNAVYKPIALVLILGAAGVIVGILRKREHEYDMKVGEMTSLYDIKQVGELASSVGHELRNPLNVMRNCSYLLNMHLTEKDDEEALKSLQILDKQIDIANRIVTDLMDFTRLQPPSRQHTDLSSLVNESLAYASVPENIRVQSSLNGSSLMVHVDTEQIGRVFTNVICNACQAMNDQGDLDISMAIEESYVWVSFRDSGCGITEENLAKIFEPLFTTKPKGFGLGLAISKRLVEQNDGEITAESQVDHGAIFRIKLPLVEGKKG